MQGEVASLGIADGATLAGGPPDGPLHFRENGLRFEVDVLRGQKTGFFLDQRDNRARVETLAAGKETLNVFAYTGGFSLYAARGGAPLIASLDISAPALDAARRNFALNDELPAVAAARHETLAEDAFAGLARLASEGRRFDLVVVDPPAFAQQQAAVPGALLAYERLTRLALGVLRPGGTLVSASCSSRVSARRVLRRGPPWRRPRWPPAARIRPHRSRVGSSGAVRGGGVFEVFVCGGMSRADLVQHGSTEAPTASASRADTCGPALVCRSA